MIAGTVVGTVGATIRVAGLQALPLVLVEADGDPVTTLVAGNPLSAGVGERVVVSAGAAARLALGAADSAVDAAIVAIVDRSI
ncbi:MAG: EutN/CcmL family microcompartment protein [Gordonia sp. (in: high G+C Gram-positive bacteria)]